MELVITDLKKSFNDQEILKGINFCVTPGNIVGLMGPSGAGKTTLIRCIIGATKASSGEVRIGETIMPNLKAIAKIGFMPQSDALYDDLSGYDNLMFFAKLFKMNRDVAKQRINELLTLLDLTPAKNKLVEYYSGGMKKRLSLAIAILHEPDVILLDEPTVGIDPVLRKKIWHEFNKLRNQGKSLLVSTHVLDEIKKCDSAALLYNGKLIENDTIENLYQKTKNGDIEELFYLHAKGDNNVSNHE